MSVVKRVRDMTTAGLNRRIDQSDNPVRDIDQFLWTTHDEINQLEVLHKQYSMHTAQLHRQWKDAQMWANKREQQAAIALQAGEEEAAKLAVRDKLKYAEQAEHYERLYEQSYAGLTDTEALLEQLHEEYRSVYERREIYVARMESLQLQQRLNARLSYADNHSTGMLNAMDERLMSMELETNSLREVRRRTEPASPFGYRLGSNDEGFVANHAIDAELNQLKTKLQQGGA